MATGDPKDAWGKAAQEYARQKQQQQQQKSK
jgi:hypothetical protein